MEMPSWAHLYRQHRARAVAVASRILRDADEAEDVVQDIFSRLCGEGARFDGRSRWSSWLHRVVVNRCINTLRSKRRRSALRTDPLPAPSPEEVASGAEVARHFEQALEAMSPQHRDL